MMHHDLRPELAAALARAGGVIRRGAHALDPAAPTCEACLHEVLHLAQHPEATALLDTDDAQILDSRSINDASWGSDEARTAGMLPLLIALDRTWGQPEVQRSAARWIALGTVRRVLPVALRACGLDASACESAGTLAAQFAAAQFAAAQFAAAPSHRTAAQFAAAAARSAAAAGYRAAARSAADAARSAASAAQSAADAARSAASAVPASEQPAFLRLAVAVWVDAIERAERGEVCP